jgi:hypothetical protein
MGVLQGGGRVRDSIPVTYLIWSVMALLAMVAIGLFVRAERRRFAARGLAGPWLRVRLASVPIALLAAGAVWLTARAVRGPEALAAFYLLMFTLGPAIYFGLLWLAGRLTVPALAARDAAGIGVSGLLMVILPAMLASAFAPWVQQGALGVQQAGRDLAAEAPAPHRIVHGGRYALPDIGDVLVEHWQAPPGIRVERIEWELGGQYLQADDGTGSILCRDGDDVHVFRRADDPAPRWRLYWRDATDELQRSDWTSSPVAAPAQDLLPVWTTHGFELPVRIPGNLATIERRWPTGRVQQADALLPRIPPSPGDTCLPLVYRNEDAETVVTRLSIRMWLPGPQRMGVASFARPDPGA